VIVFHGDVFAHSGGLQYAIRNLIITHIEFSHISRKLLLLAAPAMQ